MASDPHFLSLPKEIRLEIYHHLFRGHCNIFSSLFFKHHDAKTQCPAIIRTNRLIYEEGLEVLYSKALVYLDYRDLMVLSGGIYVTLTGEEWKPLFRHNPLHGLGWVTESGVRMYDTPEIPDTVIEPHMFAHFRDISLYAEDFLICLIDIPKSRKGTSLISGSDKDDLLRDIESYSCLRTLGKLISHFAVLERLSIDLTVEVRMPLDFEESSDYDLDEDEDMQQIAQAHQAVLEIMLGESIFWEPLRRITNVKRLELDICFDDDHEMRDNHVERLSQLEVQIERNCGKTEAVVDDPGISKCIRLH